MNMSSSTNWPVLCIWWVAWRQMMLGIWTGGVPAGRRVGLNFPTADWVAIGLAISYSARSTVCSAAKTMSSHDQVPSPTKPAISRAV